MMEKEKTIKGQENSRGEHSFLLHLLITPDDEALSPEEDCQDLLSEALRLAGEEEELKGNLELSLRFVDGEEMRSLNRQYRNVDATTDVLSFPAFEPEELEGFFQGDRQGLLGEEERIPLGDIVLNVEKIREQAREIGHGTDREAAYLAVHSFLHLLGYDHLTKEDQEEMRSREERIMTRLGFPQLAEGRHPLHEGETLSQGEPDADAEVRKKKDFHSAFIAVIGRPNAGKSTLANALLGEKISIISDKPQTTRNQIPLIYTDERMQLVFKDTPGIQIPRNELGEAMLKMSRTALDDVDLCLLVVDSSQYFGKLDRQIVEELGRLKKRKQLPTILLLNKREECKEEELRDLEQTYRDFDLFDRILPISAKDGLGLSELLDLLYVYSPKGPMYYPEDMMTDRNERFVISEMIREKLLLHMEDEIPHGIFVEVTKMSYRQDKKMADIYATIYCEKESHKGMVIGKRGAMLRTVGSEARKDIVHLLDCPVNLQLWVKVEKNWRRKKNKVKQFGYE